MNKQLFFGTIVLAIAVALAIIMMILPGWVRTNMNGTDCEGASEQDPCYHIGLREAKIDYGDQVVSVSVSSFSGQLADHLFTGGTIILATGVIGIFVYVCSMIVLCLAHAKGFVMWRRIAIFGLYISVGLLILGIVLYAYKLNAGYSFILMTVSGFFYFMGVAVVIVSGWTVGNAPPKEVPDTH